MEEDKLSRIIQQKLENQVPPYQEEFWEEAAAQMAVWEKEEKRRKFPLWWFWMIGLTLLLGMGSFGIYTRFQNNRVQANEIPGIAAVDSSSFSISPETTPEGSISANTPSFVESVSNDLPVKRQASKVVEPAREKVLAVAAMEALVSTNTTAPPSAGTGIILKKDRRSRNFRQGNMSPPAISLRSRMNPAGIALQPINPDYPQRPGISLIVGRSLIGLGIGEEEGNVSNAWQRDYSIGTEISIPFKKRFFVQTGLHYVSMPLRGIQLNAEGRSYGFSFTDRELSWNPDQATSLWLPVRVGRFIRPKHRIEAGLVVQHLLGTNGEAVIREVNGFGNQTQQTESLTGITNGMRRWGLATQVAYKFHLKGRFSAGLQYHYEFRDLTRDDAFQPNQFDANRGFRVTLEYILR